MPLFLSRKEGERFAIFDSDAPDAQPLVQVLVAEIGREVLLATLRTTPALALGIDNHRWTIEEMVDLLPLLVYNTRPKKSDGLD